MNSLDEKIEKQLQQIKVLFAVIAVFLGIPLIPDETAKDLMGLVAFAGGMWIISYMVAEYAKTKFGDGEAESQIEHEKLCAAQVTEQEK